MEDNPMGLKLIAITPEKSLPDEVQRIGRLIDAGFDFVHLRKPQMNEAEMCRFIESIPSRYYRHLKLNDFHHLARRYELGGIHLNARNPQRPQGFCGNVSRSCHSMEEAEKAITECDYVFLSPIFDSICKQGYQSRFSLEELRHWDLLPSEQVVALGGITAERIGMLREIGFGGVAFLGYLFEEMPSDEFENRIESIIQKSK